MERIRVDGSRCVLGTLDKLEVGIEDTQELHWDAMLQVMVEEFASKLGTDMTKISLRKLRTRSLVIESLAQFSLLCFRHSPAQLLKVSPQCYPILHADHNYQLICYLRCAIRNSGLLSGITSSLSKRQSSLCWQSLYGGSELPFI